MLVTEYLSTPPIPEKATDYRAIQSKRIPSYFKLPFLKKIETISIRYFAGVRPAWEQTFRRSRMSVVHVC